MHMNASWIQTLGYLSLALSLITAVSALAGVTPTGHDLSGYLFAAGLMAAVSFGLVVAGGLKQKNDPRAEKAVPSSLVAYLLFMVMTYYWLNSN